MKVFSSIKWLLVCVAIGLSPLLLAAGDGDLPDPTRPALSESRNVKPAVSGEEGAAAPGLVLQSVLLRKGGKPSAVISGQTVELNQEVNGARLIRVTETEVTLAGENGKEILKLNPAVEKKPVIEKANVKPVAKRKTSAGKATP